MKYGILSEYEEITRERSLHMVPVFSVGKADRLRLHLVEFVKRLIVYK